MDFYIKKWNPNIINGKRVQAFSLLNDKIVFYNEWIKTNYRITENTNIFIDWLVMVKDWILNNKWVAYR